MYDKILSGNHYGSMLGVCCTLMATISLFCKRITYRPLHASIVALYLLHGIRRTVPLPKPPRAHTVKLGRMTMWKKIPPLVTLCANPVLSRLSDHSDPIVLEPFDVTLWYSGVPRTQNLLKILSDIESDFRNSLFSTLYTDLNVESNFYDHY